MHVLYSTLFKTLMMKPLYSIIWATSLCGLLTTLLFEAPLTSSIAELTKVKSDNPHFFAMVPSVESLGYLQRKLSSLPGVKNVKKVSNEVLSKKIEGLMGQLKGDESLEDFETDFTAINVVMAKGLRVRSQNLIRDYLKRIAPNKNLTLGPLIQSNTKKQKNSVLGFIQHYSLLIIATLSFLAYVLCNILLLKDLRRQSFLVENYQRKKQVFSKAFSSGQVPILVALVIAMVMQNNVAYVLFVGMLMSLFAVHILGKRVKQWL